MADNHLVYLTWRWKDRQELTNDRRPEETGPRERLTTRRDDVGSRGLKHRLYLRRGQCFMLINRWLTYSRLQSYITESLDLWENWFLNYWLSKIVIFNLQFIRLSHNQFSCPTQKRVLRVHYLKQMSSKYSLFGHKNLIFEICFESSHFTRSVKYFISFSLLVVEFIFVFSK